VRQRFAHADSLHGPDPFAAPALAHFSYHKCLTVYFQRIMRTLANEYNFSYAHCRGNLSEFSRLMKTGAGKRFISLNNVLVPGLDQLTDIRGSHFIRDPRDLVVSGYRYHLWTEEQAYRNPKFDWSGIVADPWFSEHVEPDPARIPRNVSYLEYLNTLDAERGMILEMLRLSPTFQQMKSWDYGHPHIIEMRYEDIIGREAEAMEAVFKHYGLRADVLARGLQLVELLSLKNHKAGDARHVRKGTARQWESEFSPRMLDLFNRRHHELLVGLGYETA
jgi:hypothetical protein